MFKSTKALGGLVAATLLVLGASQAIADEMSSLDDFATEDPAIETQEKFKSTPEMKQVDEYLIAGKYKDALDILKPLAEKGSTVAQYKLGGMYELGLGVDKNYSRAIELYRESIKGGYPKANYKLGVLYMRNAPGLKNNCVNAKIHLIQAANDGMKEASLRLAEMFEKGITCPIDFKESVNWYKKAAEQGNAYAQNHMGDVYYKGVPGFSPNKGEALTWYRKASEQGHPEATYMRAIMRINGQGDKQDVVKGCELIDTLLNNPDISEKLRKETIEIKNGTCSLI